MHGPSPAKSSPDMNWGKVALDLALSLASGFRSIWEWRFPYVWTRVSVLCRFTEEQRAHHKLGELEHYSSAVEVMLVISE